MSVMEDPEVKIIIQEAKIKIAQLSEDREHQKAEKLFESHYAGYLAKTRRLIRVLSTFVGFCAGFIFASVFWWLTAKEDLIFKFGLGIIYILAGTWLGYKNSPMSKRERKLRNEFKPFKVLIAKEADDPEIRVF